MHKQGRDKEIWTFLQTVHKDKGYIDQLVEDFKKSKIFGQRLTIIRDALDAHLEGKYALSVPVLLAQVEGILWDIGEKKGTVSGQEITTAKGTKTDAHSAKKLSKQTLLKELIFPNFVDYYTNKIYTKDNRHAIMHGRSVAYHTEQNSVISIMMLRLLMQECEELER